MKFVFLFVALLCANLHFCRARPQIPSAHLEAANKWVVTYHTDQVITDWSVSAPYSHLAGGMKYQEGKLTVPFAGRYYIYAQIYYYNNGRAHILVNNNVVTLPQPPVKGAVNDSGAVYTGGVFELKAGDAISLAASSYPVSTVKIYMYSIHTFFGAYLISPIWSGSGIIVPHLFIIPFASFLTYSLSL